MLKPLVCFSSGKSRHEYPIFYCRSAQHPHLLVTSKDTRCIRKNFTQLDLKQFLVQKHQAKKKKIIVREVKRDVGGCSGSRSAGRLWPPHGDLPCLSCGSDTPPNGGASGLLCYEVGFAADPGCQGPARCSVLVAGDGGGRRILPTANHLARGEERESPAQGLGYKRLWARQGSFYWGWWDRFCGEQPR